MTGILLEIGELALRPIGKRTRTDKTLDRNGGVSAADTKAARWIAGDALRELSSERPRNGFAKEFAGKDEQIEEGIRIKTWTETKTHLTRYSSIHMHSLAFLSRRWL